MRVNLIYLLNDIFLEMTKNIRKPKISANKLGEYIEERKQRSLERENQRPYSKELWLTISKSR